MRWPPSAGSTPAYQPAATRGSGPRSPPRSSPSTTGSSSPAMPATPSSTSTCGLSRATQKHRCASLCRMCAARAVMATAGRALLDWRGGRRLECRADETRQMHHFAHQFLTKPRQNRHRRSTSAHVSLVRPLTYSLRQQTDRGVAIDNSYPTNQTLPQHPPPLESHFLQREKCSHPICILTPNIACRPTGHARAPQSIFRKSRHQNQCICSYEVELTSPHLRRRATATLLRLVS